MNGQELKKRLRAAREAAGVTQKTVSETLGISKMTIVRWESLDAPNEPTASQLVQLASLYGTSVAALTAEATPADKKEAAPDDGTAPMSNFKPEPLGETISVPVLEDILTACAGNGHIYQDVTANAVEIVDLPRALVGPVSSDPKDRPFVIRVEGDSMTAAGIADRDYVVINPAAEVRSGEPALVVSGDSWAVKWVYWLPDGGAELRAATLLYPPKRVSSEELQTCETRVIGRVVLTYSKPKRGA